MDSNAARAAVFFDRDGTLIEDVDYCADPAAVRVFADARQALAELKAQGYLLVVVTNQSGIGRGYFSEEDFARVQGEFLRQLGPDLLHAAYHCPDAPDEATERRKPAPGMLFEAARDHRLDLARSFLVGDTWTDIECARRAGLAGSVLLRSRTRPAQAGLCEPSHVAEGLTAAAAWILAQRP